MGIIWASQTRRLEAYSFGVSPVWPGLGYTMPHGLRSQTDAPPGRSQTETPDTASERPWGKS